MNERGKSDSPVVPAKPSNKTSVAEVVEERGLAEGTRPAQHIPDAEPEQVCETGWIVCAR